MKNILNGSDHIVLRERIAKLRADSQAQWGKMTAPEMLCHLGDQFKMAKGTIPTQDRSSFLSRNLMKNLVFWGMPAPKGKVKTAPEIDQAQQQGTRPGNFEEDRAELIRLIDDFTTIPPDFNFQRHPTFGSLSKKQWGRMAYIHINHHLSQFGL